MTDIPDWARAVPSTAGVHPAASGTGFTRPFSTEQLLQIGADLIEQFLRRIVLAFTHAFIPGIPAFEQLQQWADGIADLLWWLEVDELLDLIGDSVGSLLEINWLSPQAIWEAVTVAWDFWRGVGSWVLHVLSNIVGLDLSEQGAFLTDLAGLFLPAELQGVWVTFWHGWNAISWANPFTSLHQTWMLLVDLVWGVAGWFAHVVSNLTGINAPGWFALDQLTAAWSAFFTAWGAIGWSNPLTGIHTAWMATVDLAAALWSWVKAVVRNLTGIEVPSFFNGGALADLWQQFTAAWGGISWSSLSAVWQALEAVGGLARAATHWVIGVVQNLTGIDLEVIAASFGIDALVAAITTWADTLAGINWLSAGGLMAAVGAFITLAQALGNWVLGVIDAWLGWDTSIVHGAFANFNAFVGAIVEFFWGADGLAAWTGALDAIGGVGATVLDAIKGAYAGVVSFVGLIGKFADFNSLVEFIAGILGEDGLLGWLASLPFIGPLVSKLTGEPPSGDVALDLSTLGNWAQNLLTGKSAIPAENLIGAIPQALLGMIPVSAISFGGQNLLAQGNFNNAQTVESSDGVEWDGTYTATGTGGSMRFTGTGALQRRNSRQVIQVASGDRVTVSALVKTSGFTAGSGRQVVLLVVPWIGQVAQAEHVVAVRTAAASGAAQTMSGATIRIGGTAGAGEVSLSSSITALTVCVTVVANAGAQVWVDNISAAKIGTLAQNFVEFLKETWESAWDLVFGGGGAGKTWFDFSGPAGALKTIFSTAGLGVTNAGTALGNVVSVIDAIGKAVFGEATYSNLPSQVKSALQYFINKLFGTNTVQDDLQPGVIPPLSGSIIQDGEISIGVLPTDDIGAEVNPSSASGAQMSRRTTVNSNASNGNTKTADGFYGNIDINGVDVEIINTAGQVVTGTGAKSNLRPVFRAKTAGWYLVEICYRINPSFSAGGRIAPVLYRSTNYTGPGSMSVYKVGTDVDIPPPSGGGKRFVQNTFNVFLPVGGAVQSGHNGDLTASGVFDADTDGSTTYFSIALLNKTYS